MTFNTVSKRYQETGILKGDCKQPLRIGILRALNDVPGDFLGSPQGFLNKSLFSDIT